MGGGRHYGIHGCSLVVVAAVALPAFGQSAEPAPAQPAPSPRALDIWREPPGPTAREEKQREAQEKREAERQAERQQPWGAPPVDDQPRLRDGQLRAAVPDLVVNDSPPPFAASVGFASRAPFQVFAMNLGLVLRSDFLRFELLYGAGGTAAPNMTAKYSSYAETSLGVKVIGARSERDVDVMPPDDSPWYKRTRRQAPRLKAWLPSHHALLAEVGMFTGAVAFERCTADCDGEQRALAADTHQLFYPFAGLGYTYFIHVTSKREPLLTRRIMVEVHAHAIVAPLPSPDESLWNDGKDVERLPVGARFQFTASPCSQRCLQFGAMIGYLPVPATPIFGVTLGSGPF